MFSNSKNKDYINCDLRQRRRQQLEKHRIISVNVQLMA